LKGGDAIELISCLVAKCPWFKKLLGGSLMKKLSVVIVSLLLAFSLVFTSGPQSAEAHDYSNKQYAKRYYWGYMIYVSHNNVHKMRNRLITVGTVTGVIGNSISNYVPSIPSKAVNQGTIFAGLGAAGAAQYLKKKDHGKGLVFKIFKPNYKGFPKRTKYLIVGIYTR
jgi:hypothetical protein